MNVLREKGLDPSAITHLIIAGWTGRNVEALEKHIRELEALGVKRPKRTPIFYRVSASLLTIAASIEVLGEHSSGEIEPVIFSLDDGLWIGIGSDHTDRKAETIGVSLSKQMCGKPVSRTLWHFDDVADHWDRLILRSYTQRNGQRRLYQEGTLATMRPPLELIKLGTGADRLPRGAAMFCGTLAVHGEITPGERFEMQLDDPVLGRKIEAAYDIHALPDEG